MGGGGGYYKKPTKKRDNLEKIEELLKDLDLDQLDCVSDMVDAAAIAYKRANPSKGMRPARYRLFASEVGEDGKVLPETWGCDFEADTVWIAREIALAKAHEHGKFTGHSSQMELGYDPRWGTVAAWTYMLELRDSEHGNLFVKHIECLHEKTESNQSALSKEILDEEYTSAITASMYYFLWLS